MDSTKKERWLHLCELAADEQDPARLLELVKEINRLLEEKEERISQLRSGSYQAAPDQQNRGPGSDEGCNESS